MGKQIAPLPKKEQLIGQLEGRPAVANVYTTFSFDRGDNLQVHTCTTTHNVKYMHT